LIAISSCEYFENNGLNEPLRQTWLPDAVRLGIDYKFFHGQGSTPKEDVVVLQVEDRLFGLTEKAKAKAEWAVKNGYDFMFSCFPDTYTCPERLLKSGFENYDYFGNVNQHPGGMPYCQGGPGYVLSNRACERIYKHPTSYLNDDCWVGDVLSGADVLRGDCKDFTNCGPGPMKGNTSITNHLSTQPGHYKADSVYAEHRQWKDSWL
jgi:hypothetical protein